jgi:hypothetical protein
MKVPLSMYEKAWEMIKRESVGSAPVLVLVAYNCDAIAACRTLQVRSIFKNSNSEPNISFRFRFPFQLAHFSLLFAYFLFWSIEYDDDALILYNLNFINFFFHD